MKKIILSSFLILFAAISVLACEITLSVDGKEKSKYKTGDEIVVKVKVVLFHKNCTIDIKQTKFNQEGIKIISGTDWKEVEPGVWERKLKVKITANKGEKAKISAVRICPKGGGNESIEFPL